MKIVVFTAWFGAADQLQPPAVMNPAVRYVCMTDRTDPVAGWERHQLQPTERPRWLARWAKWNLEWLPPSTVSIWIDASFQLLVDPVALVRAAAATTAPIAAFPHPDRTRISEEADAIIRFGLAPAAAVKRQLATYQAAGFDTPTRPQSLLTTTGVLVRWTSPDVARFNAACWEELRTHTLRDQLCVDFCARRLVLPIGYLPGHYRENRFVRYDPRTHRAGRVSA